MSWKTQVLMIAAVAILCALAYCSPAAHAEVRHEDGGVWMDNESAAKLVSMVETGRDALAEYRSLLAECEQAVSVELQCPDIEPEAHDWTDFALWGLSGMGLGVVIGSVVLVLVL